MDERRMLNIVEQYSRQSELQDKEINVTRVPDWKSMSGDNVDGSTTIIPKWVEILDSQEQDKGVNNGNGIPI